MSCGRINPGANDNEALILTVDNPSRTDHYLELLQALLVDKRVDPKARDCQAIKSAVEKGWVDGLKVLLGSHSFEDMNEEEKGEYLREAEEVFELCGEDEDGDSDDLRGGDDESESDNDLMDYVRGMNDDDDSMDESE
ncbi:hypothetical protein HDU76_011842 [Blyttiomyces sp. JEL0837]|nr:hypothetical protein HDU76_011842 [Blyttiomyces sp. JEL0837]